jgi:hypothetical protein
MNSSSDCYFSNGGINYSDKSDFNHKRNNTWYLGSVEYATQSYFNDKIIQEIDKKECDKIISRINDKPFIVVSVVTSFNTIKHVNYIDRFSFEQEAKEFILNKEKARKESFRIRKEYIYAYLNRCGYGELKGIQAKVKYYTSIYNLSLYLSDNPCYDGQFPGYDPPESISDGIYFFVEIKEK